MPFTKLIHKARYALVALSSVLFLSACNMDNMAQLRIIHASPDAPMVNIEINGVKEISNLDYAQSSGKQPIVPGKRSLAVQAILPNGEAEVISVPKFQFKVGESYNILAVNDTQSIMPFLVPESEAEPNEYEVALTLVHASPAAPAVDVYVTAPDTDISSESVLPLFSFDYLAPAVDLGVVPADTYDITVTLKDTKTVAFNVSDVDLSAFAGEKLLISALSTTSSTEQDASLIKLLVATDYSYITLLDEDTQAGVRVVHLSPDADVAASGPVEVLASSADLSVSQLEIIDAFSYTDVAPPVGNPPFPLTADEQYVLTPLANDFIFDVAVDEGPVVYTSSEVALASGEELTVIAGGNVLSSPSFDLFISEDSNRSVITQASVKVAHFAPAAGLVDVYVTKAGVYTAAEIEAGEAGHPLLDGFAFGEITDYVSLMPGHYDIRVVPEASGQVAINIESFDLSAGLVGTVIARQPNASVAPDAKGSDGFGVLVLTN